MKNGIMLELDCFEWAQVYLAQHGETEPETMACISSILKPGDTFLDVGAHIGYVSLVGRKAVGDDGLVIAIEPQPYNCERILKNWEINGFKNLQLHVAAAGPSSGFVKLPQQAATDKARLSLQVKMHDALDLTFNVPIMPLAHVLTEHGVERLKLMKIDVEGYEISALQGLERLINIVENIIFEALASDAEDKSRTLEVCHWLRSHGYSLKTVDGQSWNGGFPVLDGNLWAAKEK